MDDLDRKILRILQTEPDTPVAEIGERIGLSNTPCWRRIKKLEASGAIAGRVVLLDPGHFGLTVNVYADIRLKQHDTQTLIDFEHRITLLAPIVECFSVSGDSDYILRMIVESIEDYEAFLKRDLLHLPGVAAVNSRFALGCIKMTTALPI